MNYSTKAALGIKDPYLELDTAHFKDAIEDQGNQELCILFSLILYIARVAVN